MAPPARNAQRIVRTAHQRVPDYPSAPVFFLILPNMLDPASVWRAGHGQANEEKIGEGNQRGMHVSQDAIAVVGEDKAWALLERLIGGEKFDGKEYRLESLSEFRLHLKGHGLDGTIPGRFLGPLEELQTCINRTYAYIKYGHYNSRYLHADEEKALQLNFKVRKGSSEILGDLSGVLEKMGEAAVRNMNGAQTLAAVIVIAVLLTSVVSWKAFLKYKTDVGEQAAKGRDLAAANEVTRTISQQETERLEIVTKALAFSSYARAAADGVEDTQEAVVRSMLPEDTLDVGGEFISGEEAKYRRRQPRVKSRPERIDGIMRVLGVDSSKPDGVQVRLIKLGDNLEFVAFLNTDQFSPEEKAIAQNAEWDKRPVRVHCNALMRSGEVVSAEIHSLEELTDAEVEAALKLARLRAVGTSDDRAA